MAISVSSSIFGPVAGNRSNAVSGTVTSGASAVMIATGSTASSNQPATILSLSPQAQAAMTLFQAVKGDDAAFQPAQGSAGTQTPLPARKTEAGGDILPTDHSLLNKLRDPAYKGTLDIMRKGVPGEQLASFDAALANGTLNIQRAENVPGLNYKKTDVAVEGPDGGKGGITTFASSRLPEMDDPNYRGFVGWAQGFGSFYVTW